MVVFAGTCRSSRSRKASMHAVVADPGVRTGADWIYLFVSESFDLFYFHTALQSSGEVRSPAWPPYSPAQAGSQEQK